MQSLQSATVDVPAGDYRLLVRYGSKEGEYVYSKGGPFRVSETPTHHSAVTITLPALPVSDPDAEKEYIQQEERERARNARLVDLQRRLGIPSVPEEPKPSLTLAEARLHVASLRSTVHRIEIGLRSEYPALQASPDTSKGTFETTAEYEQRLASSRVAREDTASNYATDMATLTEPYNKQIVALLARKYSQSGLKVSSLRYDADRQTLFATIGEFVYWFSVDREKARALYNQPASLHIEGNFLHAEENRQPMPDEILLGGTLPGDGLESGGVYADITGTWTGKIPWASQVKRVFIPSRPPVVFTQITFNIKADTAQLTGTVFEAPPRNRQVYEAQISEGKIEGDTISFTTTSKDGKAKRSYKGKVSGKLIDFSRERTADENWWWKLERDDDSGWGIPDVVKFRATKMEEKRNSTPIPHPDRRPRRFSVIRSPASDLLHSCPKQQLLNVSGPGTVS